MVDDLGVVVHETTADRLEGAALLAAQRTLAMHDALFVQVAIERRLPLLTTDANLCHAVHGLLATELIGAVGP